jgi:hypothetical protein
MMIESCLSNGMFDHFQKTRLWNLSGNRGNVWNHGIVRIGRVDANFQMIIDARRSYSTSGDIAIDDIQFQGCGLPAISSSCDANHQFKCNRGSCISQNRVCDYTDDCGDNTDEQISTCNAYIGCTFESGLCTFSQLQDDDFDCHLYNHIHDFVKYMILCYI